MKKERPIDRLLRWAKADKLNQANLAKALGVTSQHITNWKSRGMPPEHHAKAARVVRRSVDELVGLVPEKNGKQTKYRVFRIPVVGIAQLGQEGFWTESGYPVGSGDGYIEMPSRDENAYAVRVVGDSMHPRYMSGEYVIVHPNEPVLPGKDVVVVTSDGRVMVKELAFQREGIIALNSKNADRLTLQETDVLRMHRVDGRADYPIYEEEP